MEIRHLRYFVTVAEEENITRAAVRLNVTQPALSRQIRDLENEFQFGLFERNAKSIRLTKAGRVFLREARAVLHRAAEAVQAARAATDGHRSKLHVGYADSLTGKLLPRALRLFESERGDAQVILHDRSTKEMLCGLRDNGLDVALLRRPSNKALKGLIVEEFCRQSVCAALSPAHRLAGASQVDLRALSEERLIGYSCDEYPEYCEWLMSIFEPLGRRPRTSEEHDSSTGIIAAIEAGRGVALVPQGFEVLAGSRLIVAPVIPAPASAVVGIIARRTGKVSSTVAEFFSVVRRAENHLPLSGTAQRTNLADDRSSKK